MGWNDRDGDTKRTRALVLRFSRPDGDKRTVSFPGGVDKSLVYILNKCLWHIDQKMGYTLHEGWCWGYSYRDIAGMDTLSYHGIGGGRAIDINAPHNARGSRGDIPPSVVAYLEHHGFEWGGRWEYTDPMHFQATKTRLFYWRLARRMRRAEKHA